MLTISSFWAPVLFMGVGISTDVAITTISRFHNQSLSFQNWTLPLIITHTLFPALSYYFFWLASTEAASWQIVISAVGFFLIGSVVYELLSEALGQEPAFSLSKALSIIFSVKKSSTRHFTVVLSVSWDAFLCGPSLLPIAHNGLWSIGTALLAFCLFGLMVAITASISLFLARKLRCRNFSDAKQLSNFNFWGTFSEITIIASFGVMFLWSIFSTAESLSVSILISFFMIGVIFILNYSSLRLEASKRAEESVAN